MYLIGTNPETISTLTFVSINDDKIITYTITKVLKYRNANLNENFVRNIMLLKELKNSTKNLLHI